MNKLKVMKYTLLSASTLLATLSAYGQSFTQNFIQIRAPRTAITTESQLQILSEDANSVQTAIQYIDGVGRLLQNVQMKLSPTLSDIIQPIEYDLLGRESRKYMTYSDGGTPGSYRTDALNGSSGYSNSKQFMYYQQTGQPISTTSNPYSDTKFEINPLDRVIEQGFPGNAWQLGGGHTIRTEYSTNSANSVPLWKINGNGANYTSSYTAGTLYAVKSMDENGSQVIAYKDFEDNLICKGIQNVSGATNSFIFTHYIYDDLGNLRYVVTPLPSGINSVNSFTESDNLFNNFFYGYHYDGKNRQVEKKVPGKDWEYIVYNKLDQIILSQTSTQKQAGIWLFTKYDALGRAIITGNYFNNSSRATLQSIANNNYSFWENFTNTTQNYGYTNVSYPDITDNSANTILTVSFYDNYSFISNAAINPNSTIYTTPSSNVDSLLLSPIGMVTGLLTKVIGANGKYLINVNHYDTFGRLVKTINQTFKNGTTVSTQYDTHEKQYSFNGIQTKNTRKHYLPSSTSPQLTIITKYSFDHANRVKLLQQQYITPTKTGLLTTLAKYEYNELGQLIIKHLHNSGTNLSSSKFLQHVDYRYNPRGWLYRINNPTSLSDASFPTQTDAFAEELNFDQPNSSYSGTTPQYNGNISTVSWQSLNKAGTSLIQEIQGYVLNYDILNRLTSSRFKAGSGNGQFDETLTYDNLGNIMTLKRSPTSGSFTNDLTYDYGTGINRSNRLLGVVDIGSESYTSSFEYDMSGNITTHSKNQSTTAYNELNLPSLITFAGGKTISFYYSASGEKLERLTKLGSTILEDRNYINGIEYSDTSIDFVSTEEGRARRSSSDYILEYYLTDHLGNVRAIIGDEDNNGLFSPNYDLVQLSNYYAFGKEINYLSSFPINQYKYNGKELLPDYQAYDYGARYYDATLARWRGVDNAAESSRRWNPYTYGYNNPMRVIDPDGNQGTDYGSRYADAYHSVITRPLAVFQNTAMNENVMAAIYEDYLAGRSNNLPAKYDPVSIGISEKMERDIRQQYSYYTKSSPGGGDLGFYGSLNNDSGGGSSGGLRNFLIHLTPFGGVVDFANSAKRGNVVGAVLGLATSAAFFTGDGWLSSTESKLVYRSLNSENAATLAAGNGIFGKSTNGLWSAEQHLMFGSGPSSFLNDPWISTTPSFNIAKAFNSGHGVIMIDLNKISKSSIVKGWETLPRSSPSYHFSIWQQEVSIYKHVPPSAITTVK